MQGLRGIIRIVVAALWMSVSMAAAAERVAVNIPAQPMRQALAQLADQTGLQLIFPSGIAEHMHARGLKGEYTAEEALKQLLTGTSLVYEFVNERTVTILAQDERRTTSRTDPDAEQDTALRLARVDMPGSTAPAGEPEKARTILEEIVVTAQKRIERLQDVPVPVTALKGETLVNQNQLRIQDYFASVPGLSYASGGRGDANLSIRGVTTGGYTNPTVGITIDDVPIGVSNILGSRTAAPDFDPSDLAQIEVLRGPQGTLYGASSIGGLLKYVTIDPSTQAMTGRIQAALSSVENADDVGYAVRGAANVPLSDAFAVRASAFTRRDPGFIDDPTRGIDGVNELEASGGRLSALWRPSDTWSVKLSTLLQKDSAEGQSYALKLPGLAKLEQAALGGTGAYTHELQAYAATVSADLGNVDLVSISGYSIDKYDTVTDLTLFSFFSDAARQLFAVTGVDQPGHNKTTKFSQELRLSGALTEKIDWLVGGFFTHEDTPTHDVYRAVDPATLEVAGILQDDAYPTTYAETAAFGHLTAHFSERFDVQFGARQSTNRQRYEETYSGALVGSDPLVIEPVHTQDSSFTYLLTPRLRLSPDLMVYARFASGYRPGGPNPVCMLLAAPCEYQADETTNYELGVKGTAIDGALSFEASVYRIDWRDMQLQVKNDFGVFFTNTSQARSQGIELASQLRPRPGLSIAAWVSLNDAQLSADLPAANPFVVGSSGDRLPYSSRYSGSLSVQQEFPVAGTWMGHVGGLLSHVGDRKDVFAAPGAPRFDLPSYTQVNLNAGLRNETWAWSLFINNLTNRRGILTFPPVGDVFGITYIQPRTAGASLSRSF